MKTIKILTVAFCVLMVSSALFAEGTKYKFTFRGGMAYQMLSSRTHWGAGWELYLLRVHEWGNQFIEGENAYLFFLNGSVAVFVTPQFAIEGRFGYCKMNAFVDSYYREAHSWWSRLYGPSYSHSYEYFTKGSLSIMPISLNGLLQYETSSPITLYISGGLTIAPCIMNVDAYTGFVYSEMRDSLQAAVIIKDARLRIDETLPSLGINVGGGVDIRISRSLEINIEARYIYLQEKEFNWEMIPGRVTAEYWGRWILSQQLATKFTNEYLTEAVVVEPSMYSISGGITIRF